MGNTRLSEVDSLRGLAAISVVAFHYTFRYEVLFGHTGPMLASAPWGQYGVNLFFMVSGFVIFMTLERTRRPLDFIVSRGSRLYPTYWVAVCLTYFAVQWLGLPGKTISVGQAAANLLMFHGLFNIPHVDNVYWTLEVELIFYTLALLMYQLRQLQRIHAALAALLVLRLVYFGFQQGLQIDLPWTIYRLLILQFIPWFALGIMVYRLTRGLGHPDARRLDIGIVAAAIGVLVVVESVPIAVLAAVLTVVLYAAASGRLPVLKVRVLVWLGMISYPLYLLHENIGWALIRRMESAGLEPNVAALVTLTIVIGLATALHRLVEKPAMRWIRDRYRGLRPPVDDRQSAVCANLSSSRVDHEPR